VLETDRLLLRDFRESDAVVQRALWEERDARVPPHRRIDAEGRPTVADLAARIASQPGLLAIELRSTGEMIGYCGLIPREGSDEPELAFELLQRFWGHGYATEAARAIIGSVTGHRRLWAGVREWNTASRRVLEKLGFVETGQLARDDVHGNSLLVVLEL